MKLMWFHLMPYTDLPGDFRELFAEKVMPQMDDLFSEWEDLWWPQPMARSERAALPSFRPTVLAAE